MKGLFHIPGQRSVTFVVAIYIILIVLVLIWTNQLMETVTRNDPAQAPALLILSLIFPIALLVLSGVSLARVAVQKRAGVPGSRLRLRLIGSFALAVLVTATPILLLSTLYLKTAIGMWLAPENGRGLESGEKLAREYHSEALQRLGSLAGSAYLKDVLEQGGDIGDIWREVRDIAPYLHAMQVIGVEGERRWGNPALFIASDERAGFIDEGPLPRTINESGTVLSWQHNIGENRVILSSLLPEDFEQDVRSISLALDNWHHYGRLGNRIGGSLAVFGLYLSGPLILMAFLIGMALSERVIRPLVTLGEATRKITEGDFSFRVLAPKEDELVFLTESFNRMIRELEVSRTKIVQTEKVAAWQTIAQRLAHELRNPLTPIKLSAQRVQRKALEGKLDAGTIESSMNLILKEVGGLDKLLQDFREFAGGSSPTLSLLSLRDVLQETIERFRTVNPTLEWILISGDDEAIISADGMQMRQVLVNLMKNAMEAGSKKVTARIDPVHRGTTPYFRLQVRDDGEGIDAGRMAKVFQPYDSTRDRGSGLGLAVVQRIIYDHQGRIWFESEPESGTVFYIDLPAWEGT